MSLNRLFIIIRDLNLPFLLSKKEKKKPLFRIR